MLSPIETLDAVAKKQRPACRFDARSKAEALAWQKRTRKALWRCLALDRMEKSVLRPRIVETVDRGTHVQQKVVIQSTPYSKVPMFVLLPKGVGGRRPMVLALCGHGYGAGALCGIKESGEYRDVPEGYHRDFGVELVKRGFVVVAPEISCFGQREAKYDHLPEGTPRPSTCHNASTYAMMLGLTMPGMRVWDGMRVLDYMEQSELVDPHRIGVMGISGGGMHAFFSACVDLRIRSAVISGYFCDWRQSILGINHCTCNFVPGLLELGELSDVAALIAPRPLLVEHGRKDTIFPVGDVEKTVRRARRAWKLLGKAGDLKTDYFNDGHRINGEKAYPFLEKCLRA